LENGEIVVNVESITGLKGDEYAGSITVVITSPYDETYKTESQPGKLR